LTDRHVYAVYSRAFLVDDGIHANSGFAGLAVADDQFALSAAYWDH